MAQQVPSVRRMVSYFSHGSPDGKYKSEDRAAVITAVHEAPAGTPIAEAPTGQTVDLCIFNPTGLFFTQGVPFSETPKAGHWTWPPYVGPAKS